MSPEQVVAVGDQQEGAPLEATELIISSPTCILYYYYYYCVCVTYVGSYDIASLWRSEDNFLEVSSLLPYMGSGD